MAFGFIQKLYERNYKLLMILPIAILLISIGVLGYNQVSTGEFVSKDITLKGGLLVTVQTEQDIDIALTTQAIKDALATPVLVKELRSVSGGRVGYTFELEQGLSTEQVLQSISSSSGLELVDGFYTIESMSAALSASFWQGAIQAIALAFLFMAVVVFLYFRKIVPSLSIIISAIADLIGTLAVMDLLGIPLSTAGLAAVLMLIGYSVDSNILLSIKVLKQRSETVLQSIYAALKTGSTMVATTFVAFLLIWIVSAANILRQIATIMLIGLALDFINTWIQNAGILRIYLRRKYGST